MSAAMCGSGSVVVAMTVIIAVSVMLVVGRLCFESAPFAAEARQLQRTAEEHDANQRRHVDGLLNEIADVQPEDFRRLQTGGDRAPYQHGERTQQQNTGPAPLRQNHSQLLP